MKRKNRNIRQRHYRLGIFAEKIAALYLFFKGYKILKQRYKTPVGEIDIIARKKDTIVFVEVKARKNIEQGLYSVTQTSKKRISRAARYFAIDGVRKYGQGKDGQPFDPYSQSVRFDVIIFANWRIRHVRHAWDVAAE